MELNGIEDIGRYLFYIFDHTTASEDTRRITQEFALHNEIYFTALYDYNYGKECYCVGSFGEGTILRSFASDFDVLFCDYLRPVHEVPPDNSDDNDFLLIHRDSHTKPGYVMLQNVKGKLPQTTEHREPKGQRLNDLDKCQKHKSSHIKNIGRRNSIRHGPAQTFDETENLIAKDHVFAFKSKSIPSFARKWLQRTRYFGWPSSDQLSEFESSECFFVGVGHPDSDEYRKKKEWRISFTLQERQLMHSLNPTQHKCYILLKMIKENIIKETIGESITSYHCKTVLFYTIENSPCDLWVPENLIKCVRGCLFRLLVSSVQGHCSNYFIPDENMFDKTECRNKLHKIRYITLQILQSGLTFLLKLTSDNIGFVLLRNFIVCIPPIPPFDILILICNKIMFETNLYGNVVNQSPWNYLLSLVQQLPGGQAPSVKLKSFINNCIEHYISTTQIKQHTYTHVNQAFKPIVLSISLLKAQDLASDLSYCQDVDGSLKQKDLTRVLYFANESRSLDVLSADLIVATVYYRLNMFEKCRDELKHSLTLDSCVVTHCSCSEGRIYIDIFFINMIDHIFKDKPMARITIQTYRQTHVSSCLVFLLTQRHLIHPVLHLEMFRSFGETSNDGQDDWNEHEWIRIDSKIYFYFLKYLLHTKLEDMTQKQAAIDDMRFILEEDRNLGHRETAYNVLSWMYRQENKIAEAYSCLCESWKVKSGHNAAKWHLVLLLWDIWNTKI